MTQTDCLSNESDFPLNYKYLTAQMFAHSWAPACPSHMFEYDNEHVHVVSTYPLFIKRLRVAHKHNQGLPSSGYF